MHETFEWLRRRLAEVLREGELSLAPEDAAATIAAVVQGGYVLARAAGSPEPFDRAIEGV